MEIIHFDHYERIGQLQETYLRPALEKLLPVLEISAFGFYAKDSEIVFEPIATTTPSERVDILAKHSATLLSLYQSGFVSRESTLEEIQSMGKLLGAFANLEAPETPEVPSATLQPSAPLSSSVSPSSFSPPVQLSSAPSALLNELMHPNH